MNEIEEHIHKNNVVVFPTIVTKGKKTVDNADYTPDEAKQVALDNINTFGKDSSSVYALCIDKDTGTPTMIMGGFTDPTLLNMFLDIIKDEVRQSFLSDTLQFATDLEILPDDHI